MRCDTKRAPYGALEEIDCENLEEFSVDELQDVMVLQWLIYKNLIHSTIH